MPLLVVEDDESIGRPLTAALRGQGYDVLWAVTAAEAVELAVAEPPALVLLDLGPARPRRRRAVPPAARPRARRR